MKDAERERDGQTRKEEQKERWMSGELIVDGQQRVLRREWRKWKGGWMDR